MKTKTILFILLVFFTQQIVFWKLPSCWGLAPENVVVVANKMAWQSVELAKYYMEKRNIPSNNLIMLKAPSEEECSRDDYEKYIASPVRAFLKENDPEGNKFLCLVTLYGIPLRVRPPELTSKEKKELSELHKQYSSLRDQINKLEQLKNDQRLKDLKEEEVKIKRQIDIMRKEFQGAAVDSELALVREDPYTLEGWLPNKFFLGFRGKEIKNLPQKVILVSRLDGPSEAIVRRIIDDSLKTEKEGLQGKAYFDARWPDQGDKPASPSVKEVPGYAFYDKAIHNAAHLVEKSRRMPVVLDSQEALFQPGQCPDAALYCGWYSLAHYVDAFTWVRGSVGFHIASGECVTLKNKGSQVWCKMMLEKGVAATLGPVAEPYIQAFPLPDLFFPLLVEGRLTLAECYALSNPYWSWQMVLIGDPLYRPFKNNKNIRGNNLSNSQ
jgi:uncharacterized protein (TIGR03790 family)